MNDTPRADQGSLTCHACAAMAQAYVDGDLPRQDSLRVFLHVRQCPACAEALASWQQLVEGLGQLTRHEPPADFDARILAAVPYAAYREMAPLRARRVPAYLQPTFLPAWIRAGAVRFTGAALALSCGVAALAGAVPAEAAAAGALGVVPEALVLLQEAGRRLALRPRRSPGGA